MSFETARRIASLLKSTPPDGSDVDTKAGWWESKADTFDELGADHPVYAEQMAELAHDARDRARRLRQGGQHR